MDTTQLDPQALAAAKALRKTETGTSTDPYNAKGASGEFGAYQFMPSTYKSLAKKYLGDENAQPTVENQNKIAYSAAKAAKDSGQTPAQFASEWNSGKADAYTQGLKGTNSKGVNYDVPAYVAKFSQHYNELKPQTAQASTLSDDASPSSATPEAGAVGGFLGGLLSGNTQKFGHTIGESLAAPENADKYASVVAQQSDIASKLNQQIALKKSQGADTSRLEKALSDLKAAAPSLEDFTGQVINKSAREVIGEGLGTAVEALGAGELDGVSAVAKTPVASAVEEMLAKNAAGEVVPDLAEKLVQKKAPQSLAKTLLKEVPKGYAYDVSQNLQDPNKNALTPGLGTGLAIAGPLAFAGAKIAAPAVSTFAGGLKDVLGAPFRYLGEKVENANAISKLPEAEKVLAKSGLDERTRNFLTTATPSTKEGFGNMVDILEKSSSDLRSKTQAKDVVGREFLKPVDAIAQDAKKAGQEIQSEAMRPGKVNIGNVVQNFKDSLESKGVLARKDGTLVSTGRVPRSDLKYYESVLNEVKDVTGGKESVSRSQAHALRQRLYDTLDAATKAGGTPGTKPFSSLVDNDVNSLRSEIADSLGSKYKDAAKRYAVNQKTLSNVAKFAGVPSRIENISSKSLKLGEGLMRALGNASDKPTSLINEVTELAKSRGFKSDTNIHDLIDFADNLENLYGIQQTRSFEGGVQRGVSQAGIPTIPTSKTDLIIKAMQAATKTTNQDKIDALKVFLNRK